MMVYFCSNLVSAGAVCRPGAEIAWILTHMCLVSGCRRLKRPIWGLAEMELHGNLSLTLWSLCHCGFVGRWTFTWWPRAPKGQVPRKEGQVEAVCTFHDLASNVMWFYLLLILFVEAVTEIHPCSRGPCLSMKECHRIVTRTRGWNFYQCGHF